jgi:hypothetical protein
MEGCRKKQQPTYCHCPARLMLTSAVGCKGSISNRYEWSSSQGQCFMQQDAREAHRGEMHETAGTDVTISSSEICTLQEAGSSGLHDRRGPANVLWPARDMTR